MVFEIIVKLLAIIIAGGFGRFVVAAKEITDAEYALFPKLFHLDDYESCLARQDGLYCLGSFNIKPMEEPDPIYDMMKEYSLDPHNYNHTLLHRGYCVSTRCPNIKGTPSKRFQTCAQIMGRRQSYHITLNTLGYCKSHAQNENIGRQRDPAKIAFAIVVGILFILNFTGTLYDVVVKDENKKKKLLTSWSILSNWHQLRGPYADGDPRLAAAIPIEAARVIMMSLVMYAHAGIVHDMMYVQNTRHIEAMSRHPIMKILTNGTSAVQMFFVLSSGLLAKSLLQLKGNPPTFKSLPKLMMKRIIRIAPVYLLVVGFAATWWPTLRAGPLWPTLVEAESNICRRKFWAHTFFYSNFVEINSHCLIPTWFILVDMQLHLLMCVLLIFLLRIRKYALIVLSLLFTTSVLTNGILAYVYNWIPVMILSVPENIRVMFRSTPTFGEYYNMPWGSIPSCLLGSFVVFLHDHLQERGFKPSRHKWLIVLCQITAPLMPLWNLGSGNLFADINSRLSRAVLVMLERPAFGCLSALLLFGALNSTEKNDKECSTRKPSSIGYVRRVFCWRLWYPMGRMTLSVLMLHWCVNMTFVASTLMPITSTGLHMVVDWLATSVMSYLLAVPITLMVELPFQRFYSANIP